MKAIIKLQPRFDELSDEMKIQVTSIINAIASHKYNDKVQDCVLKDLDKLWKNIHYKY